MAALDPSCITQPVELFTQANAANGDCLFLSIAQALNAYQGLQKDALAAHLRFLGLRAGEVTSTQLRALVYMLFLVSSPGVDAVIDAWRMVRAASPELYHEYAQARVLPPDVPTAELSITDRIRFFEACMDTRLCWGEETALEFLERLLGIRCLVIVKKRLQTRSFHAEKVSETDFTRPLLFIPLSLCDVHYQSVLWEDADGEEHAAFAESELPDILLYLSQRDCDMVEVPHINLRHRIAEKQTQQVRDSDVSGGFPSFTFDALLVEHLFKCRSAYTVHKK